MAKFCKDIPKAVRIAYKHNPAKLSQPGLFSPTLIYLPIRILAFCSKILEKEAYLLIEGDAFPFLNELFSGYIVT